MKTIRERNSWVVLTAILLLFAACKGESPTAPPPGGGAPPGTTPPPTNVTVNLAASNTEPLVDSSVVITATVTQNGQAVPNGTAVEFTTTAGTFETGASSVIRTTTNGVATATLTSGTPGPARVTATVANVTRTVDVTFRARPTQPPPVSTTPTITSVTPSIGRPSGGETIIITGTNFNAPVRVLFDVGGARPVEAFVVSATENTIEVVTPRVDLGAGQQLPSDIIVITRAGTAEEQRVEASGAFTFRNETLTPRVATATPNSGPVTGGTIVTIFGDGFQAPVQVLFGSAEARVIRVDFSEIQVEAPSARDTSPDGSGTVTGPVPITVRNISSQTTTTLADGFRYVSAMQITSVRPVQGPATGGTDITIDGTGFVGPVDVTVAGVRARVLRVSGTQILVRTDPLASPCASAAGPIVVTNVANGDTDIYGDAATEQGFTYIAVAPFITSVSPTTASPGQSVTVVVRDPGIGPLGYADIRFSVVGKTVIPSPSNITEGAGNRSFTVALPMTGFDFPTVACTTDTGAAGTRLGPVEVPLTFTNLTTGCTDVTTVVVNPPGPNTCVQAPPEATVTQPASGCATVTATAGSTNTTEIVFRNDAAAGAQALTVTAGATTGTNASEFQVSPASQTIAPGQTQTFIVTFAPDATATGTRSATAPFTTNDPANPSPSVCLTGTAVAP